LRKICPSDVFSITNSTRYALGLKHRPSWREASDWRSKPWHSHYFQKQQKKKERKKERKK
jgi:hypothetical protein